MTSTTAVRSATTHKNIMNVLKCTVKYLAAKYHVCSYVLAIKCKFDQQYFL